MARIAFVQNNPNENLGAMQLIACLKQAGHEADCFIAAEERDLVAAVGRFAADIVGFTAISGMHRWCVETARAVKTKANLTVLGGPHPTYFPEVIEEPGIDIVCLGEGEGALVELADRFGDMAAISRIANLHVKVDGTVVRNEVRGLIADLDELPLPDRESFYKYKSLRAMSRKTVLAGRGCPYSCTFCYNNAYRRLYRDKGNCVRFRSPASVIAEIVAIRARYPLKSVYFQDDTFVLRADWLEEFLGEYQRRVALPFTCLVRADLVGPQTVSLLKQSGCVCVHFGIESGSERIRGQVLGKGVSDAQIVETARLLHQHKIRFKTYNMLRLPGETLADALETVALNTRIGAHYPWASLMCPYPKTDMAVRMVERGMLPADYGIDDVPVSFFNVPRGARQNRADWPWINLQRLFFYAVKFPRLLPLVKRLIGLRPNLLYDALFLAAHAYNYRGSENMTLFDALRFGLKSVRTSFR